MTYRLYKTIGGKIRIKHNCAACRAAIENEITEAGEIDQCPNCGAAFTVPAKAARMAMEQRAAEAALEKQANERKRDEMKKARLEDRMSEAKSVRATPVAPPKIDFKPYIPMVRDHSAVSHDEYPALQTYVALMKAIGIVVAVLAVLTILFGFIQAANGDINPGILVYQILAMVVFGLIFILPFFVGAEIVQLALDAKQDLARIAAAAEDRKK